MATKKNSSAKTSVRKTKKASPSTSPAKSSVTRKRASVRSTAKPQQETVMEKPITSPLPKSVQNFRFKKSYAIIILAAVVVIAILYAVRGFFVAATVNGQPISRLTVISELEKQSGKQTLDSMITKELITQEAKKRNITLADKQVDDEIKKIESNLKQQGQDLDQVLALQGLTRESLRDQIKVQKTVEAILGNKVTVNDKEVDDYIASNSAQLPTDMDQKQLREQVKQQLRQQKLSNEFQTWLADLRKNAKIDYVVTY